MYNYSVFSTFRPSHLHHNRKSRSRSRSLSYSPPPSRRHSSPIVAGRGLNKKKKTNKKKVAGRFRSRSRSPSIILEGRYSPSAISPTRTTRKGRKGRSPSPLPLRKKLKDGKVSKKVGKIGAAKKSAVAVTTKKGKNKKSKRNLDVNDDIIVEKAVVGAKGRKKNKNRRLNVVGGSNVDDLSLINTHVSSEVADKEVYASGDKIMVSVNFRSNTRNPSPKRSKNKKSHPVAAMAKPMCVIDIMQSPYRIIEDSPKEVVDVYSDEDESKKKGANNNNVNNGGVAGNNKNQQQPKSSANKKTTPPTDSAQHKTPSPKETPEKQQQQQLQQQQQQLQQQQELYEGGDLIIHLGHKGPCTPPHGETMIDLTRGPQTPSDPPDDSYDPCNPTESPDISWDNQVWRILKGPMFTFLVLHLSVLKNRSIRGV